VGLQRIDNIGIGVRDVRASAEFWRERVGLAVDESFDGEPPSIAVHVGGQYLYVFQSTGAGTVRHEPSLSENPLGLDHVSFTVDDVDEEYARLAADGVAFDAEPESVEAWGIRLAPFRDPDGNLFYLVQPL